VAPLLLAATAAVLAVILAVVLYRTAPSSQPPAPGGESKQPPLPPAQASAQTPSTAAGASQRPAEDRRAIEDRLNSIRAAARRQMAVGQRQQVLDTLSAGLVLEAADPELNGLIDALKRAARQTAAQARVAASRSGATEDSSVWFRDGRAREREADSLDRSGDRAQAIRVLWAATDLYERAASLTMRGATAASAPAPTPQPPPESAKTETPPMPPQRQPPAPLPTVEKSSPPPVAVTSEPSTPASVDPARESRTGDVAAIEDALRRYAEAYRSRDIAAVKKILPSLSPQQVRSLEKDLSNYRSYSVEIADVRVLVGNDTATATCQVTRSFVTKNGVAGGHTVATIFHLRKAAPFWVIERLE
jgi:hypothetical protein